MGKKKKDRRRANHAKTMALRAAKLRQIGNAALCGDDGYLGPASVADTDFLAKETGLSPEDVERAKEELTRIVLLTIHEGGANTMPDDAQEGYTDIPCVLLDLKLSPGAFDLAVYLCYLYDHVSRTYPPIEVLARSRKMSVVEATACEAQLLQTGFLIKHEDGTFSLMDK